MAELRIVALVCLACIGLSRAGEHVTITVQAGARQTFMGMGTSQTSGEVLSKEYDQFPAAVRDSMNKTIYQDCKFRYLRIWSGPSEPQKNFQWGNDPIVKDARKWNPDLEFLFGPWGGDYSDIDAYTKDLADRLQIAKEMGWNPTTTGIANEPDMHDQMLPWQAPLLIKSMRRTLDTRAMHDIKIIAAENTSADEKAQEFTRAIIADPQALEDLDGFSTHSYNSSITEEMEEIVRPYVLGGHKTYWQTESSDFIYEEFNDGYAASSALARFLSDMNRLCNVWIFYRGIQPVNKDNHNWDFGITGRFTGFYMILCRYDVMDYRKFLKCWYFQAMNAAVDIGAVFRKSKANFTELNPDKYWWKDDWMEFAFGRKTPIYLAAAVNPDGSWGVGICNYTGVKTPPDQPELTSLEPATDYRITLRIEELADRGDIRFGVQRANRTAPHIHEEDSITMHGGELVIDSIGSFELLCLRSTPQAMPAKQPPVARVVAGAGLSARMLRGGAYAFDYALPPGTAYGAVHACLHITDAAGRETATVPFKCASGGIGTVVWNGKGSRDAAVAPGYYIAAIQAGACRVSGTILIDR